jgi:hypothetical protein
MEMLNRLIRGTILVKMLQSKIFKSMQHFS